MKVFLSWSGERSHKVALALRDWLPSVLQSIEPYVSSEDIDKGARWSMDIAKELEDSKFGILCVTKNNMDAPWLIFEAGALSKTMEKSYVTPFLVDIKRSEVKGPILQFQSTIFEREDLKKLIKDLNKACGSEMLEEKRLLKTFDVWYPELEKSLENVIKETKEDSSLDNKNNNKDIANIIEEVLEISRVNQKIIRSMSEGDGSSLNSLSEQMVELNSKINEYTKRVTLLRSSYRKEINNIMYDKFFSMKLEPEIRVYMIASTLRNEFSWMYDYINNIVQDIKGGQNLDSVYKKIKNMEVLFKEIVYSSKSIGNISRRRERELEEVIYPLIDSLFELLENNSVESNSILT